jgi:hypothetical protein
MLFAARAEPTVKNMTRYKFFTNALMGYVQLVLLLARYGFSAEDFEKEFWHGIKEELPERLNV